MKNGLYLTPRDVPSFGDDIGKRINSYNNIFGIEVENTKDKQHCQNVTFVVTEGCNLNCSYCYETHKTKRVMTREIAKEAIDMLFDEERVNGYYDTSYSNAVILEFIGGEPFLNMEVIDYAVEYFRYKALELNHPWGLNYMISFSSNGTLYFDEKVQEFLKRNEGRVSLGITIDGNKRLHDSCRVFYDGSGSYDVVAKAVKDWNSKKCGLNDTKVTLAPANIRYLVEGQKGLYDLGIEYAFTNCCFEEGWTIEHAKILYEQLKELADWILDNNLYDKYCCSLFDEDIGDVMVDTQNWCGGNGNMLAIGTDGKCYSCIRFMQYSLNKQPEQPIGNIYKGLDSVEDNCFLCKLKGIDMITQCKHKDNKKCLDCPIARGCALCTGFNYDNFGDPDHKATYICDMHRARVLANVYFWNKLYQKLDLDKTFKLNLDKETSLTIINEDEYKALKKLEKGR